MLALLALFTLSAHAATLTFDQALRRALDTRGVDTAFVSGISQLETMPGPLWPTLRLETAAQRTENIDVLSEGYVRFDALTTILSVDYPLLDRNANTRRYASARTDAMLFRRRALDEADEVFRETLDAFTALYLAERRMELLDEGVRQAAQLRERSQKMLELGQITNVTAANWQEQALAMESAVLDIDLQRLEAQTRLKQLIGDMSPERLDVTISVDAVDPQTIELIRLDEVIERDANVDRANLIETKRKLALEDLEAQRRPQMLLSAFGGFANVPGGVNDGTFGIYGLRFTFTLPSRDASAATRLAEAQLELESAQRMKDAAEGSTRQRVHLLQLAMSATEKRIDLLTRAVEVARSRQQSITRLVVAGLRTPSDLMEAVNDVARRESDLLAARVERWKVAQTARRLQTQRSQSILAAQARGLVR